MKTKAIMSGLQNSLPIYQAEFN